MEEIERLVTSKRMFEQMSDNANPEEILTVAEVNEDQEDDELFGSIISKASSDVFRKAMLKSCRSGMFAVARHISNRQLAGEEATQ